jgi:hypothetical protein
MKRKIVLVVLVVISISAYSQLKVTPTGYVGVGTNSPITNLHVNGRIYLTGNNNTLRIMPNNPGVEIGSTTDVITFWTSTTGHNKLYAESYTTASDRSIKANIEPLQSGLNIINQLKTYSYNLKTDSINFSEKISYGLIAQEVETVLPAIVDTSKGIKLINYDEFIPFLILSIQEQQAQIQTLQSIVYSQEKEIVNLNSIISNCCGTITPKSTDLQDNKTVTPTLFQNAPNPFTESTIISFSIPESFSQAKLIIHNLNGVEIKSYPVNESGTGNITINGTELNPGMYLYTLIVDNQIIDTKRMILTN